MKELDNKIVECYWDQDKKVWKFMRQRTDKSFPNAYATAMGELVFSSPQIFTVEFTSSINCT